MLLLKEEEMGMAVQTEDKRLRRSDETDRALRYQLEQVIEDFDLMSCVLSDTSGRVVAEAHNIGRDVEPRVSENGVDLMMRDTILDDGSDGVDLTDDIDCVEFHSLGDRYFITAQGCDDSMREVALYRVVLGARRIHREFVSA